MKGQCYNFIGLQGDLSKTPELSYEPSLKAYNFGIAHMSCRQKLTCLGHFIYFLIAVTSLKILLW